MATKRKVIINFRNYSDAELYLVGSRTLLNLTGNTHFPDIDSLPPLTQPAEPAPPTPNLTNANALYFTKLLYSGPQGSTEANNAKNEAREVVEGMLNKWASYVNLVADGNLGMLLSSGFDLNKEKQKAGILPAPEGIKVSSPGAGQLEARIDPVKGSNSYNWLLTEVDFATEAPVTGVQPFTISTVPGRIFLADDERIVRGKCYKIQAAAIGTDRSAVNWSNGAVTIIS